MACGPGRYVRSRLLAAVAVCALSIVTVSPLLVSPTSAATFPATSPEVSMMTVRAAARQPARSISIRISGLPRGVRASVKVTGPKRYKKTLGASALLKKLAPGKYRVVVSSVTLPGGALAKASVSRTTVKVGRTTRASVVVTYSVPARLRFNFANMAALAVAKSASVRVGDANLRAVPESNLDVMEQSGVVRSGIISSSAQVSGAWISPDGSVYMELVTPQKEMDGCFFIKVSRGETDPTCVMASRSGMSAFERHATNAGVQFDAQARAYFYAQGGSPLGALYRYDNGTTTVLTNSQSRVEDFLVAPDGSVFVSGMTDGGADWTRRIHPSGQVQSLAGRSTPLGIYPDGNAYFVNSTSSVQRYLMGAGGLDPSPWVSPAGVTPSPHFQLSDACPSGQPSCSLAEVAGKYSTSGGKVFVLNGAPGGGLIQTYPVVAYQLTSVSTPHHAAVAANAIVLAGKNTQGADITTRFDTATQTETQLLPANQVEVYHLRSTSGGPMVFDGLRYSDGRYVLGTIDPVTGTVAIQVADDVGWVNVTSAD